MPQTADYHRFRSAIAGERLPCAIVDLDAFDANLAVCVELARRGEKSLRLASKSVRAPALLRRAIDRAGGVALGLMCFTVAEAVWLATEEGFDDLLVAYPTMQGADLDAFAQASADGRTLSLVVDSEDHLEALARAGREHGTVCRAVVELDVSYRPGIGVHVGARRSPLRDAEAVLRLCRRANVLDGVEVIGLMAYEAHIAGLTDKNPFTPARNPIARALKGVAGPRAAKLRAGVVEHLRAGGIDLEVVNGGGTGSLEAAAAEPALTEVTAGSALLAPHLFDYYRGLSLRPAAAFACQVVRSSDPGYLTCHGGGWIASGESGADRSPRPWLPAGLELVKTEGCGEVQTPLTTSRCKTELAPGDPVFFRHSKAGELAEHVNELLLVQGDRIVDRARTYRGHGQAFL